MWYRKNKTLKWEIHEGLYCKYALLEWELMMSRYSTRDWWDLEYFCKANTKTGVWERNHLWSLSGELWHQLATLLGHEVLCTQVYLPLAQHLRKWRDLTLAEVWWKRIDYILGSKSDFSQIPGAIWPNEESDELGSRSRLLLTGSLWTNPLSLSRSPVCSNGDSNTDLQSCNGFINIFHSIS